MTSAQIIKLPMTDGDRRAVDALGLTLRKVSKASFEKDRIGSVIEAARSTVTGWPSDPKTGEPIRPVNRLELLEYNGSKVYTLTAGENYSNIILYLHGGAYLFDMTDLHALLCDKLAADADAKVYIPLYGVIPEHTYKDGYALTLALYNELLKQGKPITIMGDSAGGAMACGFSAYCAENSITPPDKLVLISPWLDATMSDPAITEYEDADFMLGTYGLIECGKHWAGDKDPRDPLISPLYLDRISLPDTLLFVGTAELMCPDVTTFFHKIKDTVNVTLVYGEGFHHTFAASTTIEQGRRAQQIMIDFLCR